MDKAIRQRALGYAAKVALGAGFAGFVVACGGSSDAAADQEEITPATDDELIKATSACTQGLKSLREVFPRGDKDWYSHDAPDPKLVANKAVTACCHSMLTGADPTLSKLSSYRNTGCCASDRSTETAPGGVTACTPWGPPVPPSMAWTAKAIA
jgi:hypothetical protein